MNLVNKLLTMFKSSVFFNNFVSAFMVVVIVVLSFLLGTFYTRTGGSTVNYGAKNANDTTGSPTAVGNAAAGATLTDADLAPLAKEVGLDQAKVQNCINSGEKAGIVSQQQDGGAKAGVQGTPSTFVYNKKTGQAVLIGGAYPYDQLKTAIDGMINGNSKDSKVVDGLEKPAADDRIRGNKNANVVLIEYSDFQCPFCKKFEPTIEQAMTEYKDKIALVHRHFPLTEIHQYAQKMAEASECVLSLGGMDKFWAYAAKLYAN